MYREEKRWRHGLKHHGLKRWRHWFEASWFEALASLV
jgi:hypothetical protein